MKSSFQRSIEVQASPDQVWEILVDVPRVASWISIVGSVKEKALLSAYEAVLEDRIGPFKLRANLTIEVLEWDAARLLHAHAAGEDRQVGSRIDVDATLHIETDGDRGSRVQLTGVYEVTGRVATLGAGSIKKKGDTILDEFVAHASRAMRCS